MDKVWRLGGGCRGMEKERMRQVGDPGRQAPGKHNATRKDSGGHSEEC